MALLLFKLSAFMSGKWHQYKAAQVPPGTGQKGDRHIGLAPKLDVNDTTFRWRTNVTLLHREPTDNAPSAV